MFALDPAGAAIAYLDPPYAPPRDDTCYVKRYHFLEGLATYWRGQEIMWETRTRKLRKRHTPFGSKRTVRSALDRLFDHFRRAEALVVSYGSNADLGRDRARSAARPPPPLASAGSRSRTATRSARTGPPSGGMATEYVFVGRRKRPGLYSGRCRRW